MLQVLLTNEDRHEEYVQRYADDRRDDVHEPVGRHRKEAKKQQEEKQTVRVLLDLQPS